MNRQPDFNWIDWFRRQIAIGCAVLIFVLGLFAASPLLHEQLHHKAHASSDDGCVVTMFASGVSLTVVATAPPPPAAEWVEVPYHRSLDFFLASPRYLLPAEHGPPVG